MSGNISAQEVCGLLREAVAIDSVNHNYGENRSGEANLCDWVELFLQKHGIAYESQTIRNRQRNIIARIEGRQSDRTLCFEAHLDTTTARGMSVHPFGAEQIGDGIYGRGTCDCKGALAAMLAALAALKTSGQEPPQTVILAATVDKEVGMTGIQALLASGLKLDAAVVGGPTDLAVAHCFRGCTRWRILVGESPHSYAPAARNAISDTVRFLALMDRRLAPFISGRRHPTLGEAEIRPVRIRASNIEGFLPPHCAVDFECYTVPTCTFDDIAAEVNDLISSLLAEEPMLKLAPQAPLLDIPPAELAENSRLVQVALAACRDVLGSAETTGYTDAGHANRFAAAGIETIVLGPGDMSQIRASDEHVPAEQLDAAARIYLQIMQTPLPQG